MLQTTPKNA